MSDEAALAFRNLSTDSFPFTVSAYRDDTGEKVWEVEVTGPGVLSVPPLKYQLGVTVSILIRYPDGEVRGGALFGNPP